MSDHRNAMGVGLVFEADLATKEHASHWILQGVCLLLNTDWFCSYHLSCLPPSLYDELLTYANINYAHS